MLTDRPAGVAPSCLYCGYSGFDPWLSGVRDRLGVSQAEWAFWRCQDCGSAMLVPCPSPAELAAFYPPVYDFAPWMTPATSGLARVRAWLEYALFFGPLNAAHARQIDRATHGGPGRDRSILDIGCGQGLLLLAFRRLGYKVVGADFRLAVAEYLKQRFNIPVVCTDVAGLATRFEPGSLDVVTAIHVLEHVPDVHRVLQDCFRLLRPGGWVVASIPAVESVQARLLGSSWAAATEAPRHVSIPSMNGMARACREAGFSRVELQPGAYLDCLGALVLSVVPRLGSRHRPQRWFETASLLAVAAGVGILAIPWVWGESYVVRRPALAVVFAQRPEEL